MVGKKGKSVETPANKDKSAEVNTGKNAGNSGPRGIGAGRKLANATTDRISQYKDNWLGYWGRHPISGAVMTAGAPFYWVGKKVGGKLRDLSGSNEWNTLIGAALLGGAIPTINGYNLWDASSNGAIDFKEMAQANKAAEYVNLNKGPISESRVAAMEDEIPYLRLGNSQVYNDAFNYMKLVRPDAVTAADNYKDVLFNLLAPSMFQGGQPETDVTSYFPDENYPNMFKHDRYANRTADMLLALQQLDQTGGFEVQRLIKKLRNREYMQDTQRDNLLSLLPQAFQDYNVSNMAGKIKAGALEKPKSNVNVNVNGNGIRTYQRNYK